MKKRNVGERELKNEIMEIAYLSQFSKLCTPADHLIKKKNYRNYRKLRHKIEIYWIYYRKNMKREPLKYKNQ